MRKILVAAATCSLVVSLAACDEKPTTDHATTATNSADAKPDFVMRPLAKPSPQIVGGAPADPAKFPATLTISGRKSCTATVVGPQAVLTAAHCIEGGGSWAIDTGLKQIALSCSPHPNYPTTGVCNKNGLSPNCGRDVAMCYASAPISLAGGANYEVVASTPAQVPTRGLAVILGYGCTTAGQQTAGTLNVASAPITSSAVDGGQGPAQFINLTGGAAICQGDSGGAAYDSDALASRTVIGVNSSVSPPPDRISYLAPVLGSNRQFLENWAKTNKAPICGITPGAQNCRH